MRIIRTLAILLSLATAFACISCDIRDIQLESGETEGKEESDNTVQSVDVKTLEDIRSIDPDAFFYLFYAFFENDGKWNIATLDENLNVREIRSVDKKDVSVDDLLRIEPSSVTDIFDVVEAAGIPTASYSSGMISLVFETSDGARATVYFSNNEQVGFYVTDVKIDPYSVDFNGMKYPVIKEIMGSKGEDIGSGVAIYEWQMPDGKLLHVWFDTSNWILDEYKATKYRIEDPIIPETDEPTEVFYDEYTEGPDCILPTEEPYTYYPIEDATEVPTDEPVGTGEPIEIATEVPEGEITVKYSYFHPMYVDYKTVSGEIAERIANGLEVAKLTSEKVDRIANGSPELNDLYWNEYDVPFYTFWIEVGSRVYRSTSNFETLALVDGLYGEGYCIELDDELKKDIKDAWYYHPLDYYFGEYFNSTDRLQIEHKYEAPSSVQVKVVSVDADEIGDYAKNSIVLEITSDRDQSFGIYLECSQGGDIFTNGDTEVITARAGVPQRVTLDFGAFDSRYYIYISIDNTYYQIMIHPD